LFPSLLYGFAIAYSKDISATGTQRLDVVNNVARTRALGLSGLGKGAVDKGCALRRFAVRLPGHQPMAASATASNEPINLSVRSVGR